MSSAAVTRANRKSQHKVVVIGAGFAGMAVVPGDDEHAARAVELDGCGSWHG